MSFSFTTHPVREQPSYKIVFIIKHLNLTKMSDNISLGLHDITENPCTFNI